MSTSFVAKVLREKLNMRWKKIRRVDPQTNSVRSIVLRHLSAKILLHLMSQNLRLINVDETWLDTMEFKRRRWVKIGTTTSLVGRKVDPRISLIAAIDTHGSTWVSLT